MLEFGNVEQIKLVKKLNKLDNINKEKIDDVLSDLDREIESLESEKEIIEEAVLLLEKLKEVKNLTDTEMEKVLSLEKYVEE